MNLKNKNFLSIGSFLFISIGGYHIFLPYLWNWKEFSNTMPDMVEWALYAVNFFMSCLMILIGIFTLVIIKKQSNKNNLILLLGALYWVSNFVYQIIYPTPIPQELYAMKIGFLIPPVIGFCCYIIPFIAFKNSKEKNIL
ncbi:MAG: hypothetical protein R2785_10370 [Flavobacteriaceae bacterium]